MTAHADILDERERPLRPHLLVSLLLHVSVFMTVGGYSWWSNHGRIQIGDPNALGGSVGITPVSSIPLPRRSQNENLVANDTKSNVPTPPKPVKEKALKEVPMDAIPLKSKLKMKREREMAARTEKYRAEPDRPNQVYSDSGRAASSPMFGGAQGMGGVGAGTNIFGARLGWYAQMLTQALANKWGVEAARLPGSPRKTTLAFDIQRDGTITKVRILESSGNSEADYAAQRAVLGISPFRRLPEEFERNMATVEFWFQTQR